MATKSFSNILSVFAVLQVFLVLAKAAEIAVSTTNLTVSSSIDDYTAATARKCSDILSTLASALNDFRTDYQRHMDAITYNKDLIETQLVDNDQKLYSLSFLNDQRKYCVQKYSNQLVTVATVRAGFTSCVTDAAGAINSILTPPTLTYQNLLNWFTSTWSAGLTNCQRTNSASYQNQTICVANFITGVNTVFSTNQRTFNTQMGVSQCTADSRIRGATECVYATMSSAVASIGVTSRMVEDCINGISLCPPCTAVATPQCANTVSVVPDSMTFTNQTIKNPFQGLSSTSDCAMVNFKK